MFKYCCLLIFSITTTYNKKEKEFLCIIRKYCVCHFILSITMIILCILYHSVDYLRWFVLMFINVDINNTYYLKYNNKNNFWEHLKRKNYNSAMC